MKTTEKKTTTTTTEQTTTEQTTTTTEQKKGKKTMKKTTEKTAKNAPKTEAAEQAKTTEQKTTTTEQTTETGTTDAKIAKLRDAVKTAATADAKREAAEKLADAVKAFNSNALTNAVNRASFLAAAEAFRPDAPKTDAAKKNGVDYTRRADVVTFNQYDDEGLLTTRRLTLTVYAEEAAKRGLLTAEQADAAEAALTAADKYLTNAANGSEEGCQSFADALTDVVKACGLSVLTERKTADGSAVVPFFVHKSFVRVVGVRLRAKRGVFYTPSATREAARLAVLTATTDGRAKAEERAEKAEVAAVRSLFAIISEAAKAAVFGQWKADVLTADAVKADAAKKAADAAKAEQERAERRAAKDRERAAKLTERAAKLRANAEKADAEAAKLTEKKTA